MQLSAFMSFPPGILSTPEVDRFGEFWLAAHSALVAKAAEGSGR